MAAKADSDLIRRQNRNAVLTVLRRHGAQPRVDIGRLTRLSPASISTISAQLIEEGLLTEIHTPLGQTVEIKRGRPTVALSLVGQLAKVLAIKISAEGLEFGCADFAGAMIFHHTTKFPQRLVASLDATLLPAFLIRELGPMVAALKPAVIGLAVQGHADSAAGVLRWSPAFAARDIKLVEPVQDAFSIPCHMANDANMIAEHLLVEDPVQYGAHTACVFMGYGVGMGLITDGRVYQGANGAASEFGHMNHIVGGAPCMCGQRGCLEAYAGNYAIMRQAFGRDEDDPHNWLEFGAEDILELERRAEAGDAKAVAAYDRAGRALGFGIGRMVALVNPARVVIAGASSVAAKCLEQPLRQAFEESVVASLRKDVVISFAALGEDLILRGTMGVLLRNIDQAYAANPAPILQQAGT